FKALDPFPIDATIRFLLISAVFGLPALFRQGLYLPGLTTFGFLWLFQLWVIITYSWSLAGPAASSDLMEAIMLNTWVVVAGALIIAPNPERVRRLIGLCIFFGGLVAAIGLVYYMQNGTVIVFERSYKLWSKPVGIGLILGFLLLIHARFLTVKQMMGLTVVLLCVIYMLVARGRGAFLATAATCMIPLVIGPASNAVRRVVPISRPQFLAITAVVLAVGIVSYMYASGQSIPTIGRLFQAINTGTDAGLSVNRVVYTSAALDYWLQAPIFGHGFGSFSPLLIGRYNLGAQPHNLSLAILSEQGLIGFILFGLFLWSVYRHVTYQKLRDHSVFLAVFMLSIWTLLQTVTDGHLANVRELFFFHALLCMLLPSTEQEEEDAYDEEEWDDEWDEAAEPEYASDEALAPLRYNSFRD
ncbi:MAG: O-antigen ligase family protein, partial [Pseudomonadota bacterium]